MIWNYDPSLSSTNYLALARKRQARGRVRLFNGFETILDQDVFDRLVHKAHVKALLNPVNWSDKVRDAHGKPRVFIDAYVNQLGNLEVRSGGGYRNNIFFPADYSSSYELRALRGNSGSSRSYGELALVRNFDVYASLAVRNQHPVAKAVIFAVKARLDELVATVASTLELVGSCEIEFAYETKQLSLVDVRCSLPIDRLRAMRDAAWSDNS